ncbi:translation initiation factor IF-6 [Candidatus Woesearchaeota archaeon]|nr:translation initiation factor IF-6 [Candidatus Woesearchaeota archaeon]
MKTKIIDFQNNSNIGLYAYVNDNIMLVGKDIPEEYDEELKNIFQVPICKTTIAGASFINVFIIGDGKKIMVPSIIFEEELQELKNMNLQVEVLETKQTCLGNNIIIAKEKILVNNDFTEPQIKKIESFFEKPVIKLKNLNLKAIGSLVAINHAKQKAIIGNDITDEQYDLMKNLIGYELTPSSINMGSPYLKSGILVNVNGLAVGKASGGPEVANAEEALGGLDND